MSLKVLFISWAGPGHVNPLLGTAEHVLAAGHSVEWITVASPGVDEDAPGPFAHRVLAHHPPMSGRPPADDFEAYVRWSSEVHFANLDLRVERLRARIRRSQADGIAVSGLVYDGVIAAHTSGIPYACLSTELTLLAPDDLHYAERLVAHRLRPLRAQAFKRFGFLPEFRCNEALSPYRNFVFTTDAFVRAGARTPAALLVGPSLPTSTRYDRTEFPWERLAKDKKIVYAALGSQLSLAQDEVVAMAAAVRAVGAQLVVATGSSRVASSGLPGDVIAVPSAPQPALLERAAAFITHGGANSIMEAMYHGVPMLVRPVRYDQPLNAHFVVEARVGLSLPRAHANAEGYASALSALLGTETFRRRAAQVRASYRLHNGGRAAAREILSLGARETGCSGRAACTCSASWHDTPHSGVHAGVA